VSIYGIDLLSVLYRRFPLTHEVIHGEFGAMERLNLNYAPTPLSCQSHRDKCFEIHVFFVCHSVCNLVYNNLMQGQQTDYLSMKLQRWIKPHFFACAIEDSTEARQLPC
jgi:hypothetical protein